MTITRQKRLEPGDILLACSDGLWSGLGDERLASLGTEGEALVTGLRRIGEQAVRISSPHSDNTSAVALRMLA
jgi:serine/threonine protein phosphatase PrpC